ncbi:MAG: glycosyltransferase family 2 protein [Actinomycetota bacterium]|nr:glycosyltransferase family 2 protein [Actinomycetota bacterium]
MSLIVPATDRPPTLPRCLHAVARARCGPDEVIVIDHPIGAGPARARNDGAQRARGDILVFLDADVEIHPDAFVRIRTAFAGSAALDAVFGAYDDRPEAPGPVSSFRNLLHHHVHCTTAGPAVTFWAGIGGVRREAFLGVGGFDADRYPRASIEDIDLGTRLTAAGGHIVLDPEIQGTHLKAWTLRTMLATDVRRRGAPWIALLLRERSAASSRALNLGWRHRASAVLSVIAAAAVPRRCSWASAGAVVGLLGLNRDFYALLVRQRGNRVAALGVGLHVVHHLTGIASIPSGVLLYLRERNHQPTPGS